MINHFLYRENVKLLVNVGCCYNLLSQGTPWDLSLKTDGFPMSHCFRERGIQLDQDLRQLAVQATSRWTTDSLEVTTRKHFYRALLQVLFDRHGLDPVVGRMPPGVYRKGFGFYVRKVVERLQLPSELIDEAELLNDYNDQRVLAALCMRAMCSAVIETLILLDRWLVIQENLKEGYVGLHRIFDAETSPRCWAIVATR